MDQNSKADFAPQSKDILGQLLINYINNCPNIGHKVYFDSLFFFLKIDSKYLFQIFSPQSKDILGQLLINYIMKVLTSFS